MRNCISIRPYTPRHIKALTCNAPKGNRAQNEPVSGCQFGDPQLSGFDNDLLQSRVVFRIPAEEIVGPFLHIDYPFIVISIYIAIHLHQSGTAAMAPDLGLTMTLLSNTWTVTALASSTQNTRICMSGFRSSALVLTALTTYWAADVTA